MDYYYLDFIKIYGNSIVLLSSDDKGPGRHAQKIECRVEVIGEM